MFYCVGTTKPMFMAEGQRYPMVFFRPAFLDFILILKMSHFSLNTDVLILFLFFIAEPSVTQFVSTVILYFF